MDNTPLVLKMYEYFNKGDMNSIKREVFHPNIDWTMPGHHPLSARMEGVDAVIAFFGRHSSKAIFTDADNAWIFGVLDDGTMIEKHMGHGKIGNEEFLFPTCTSYGIKDGRIFEVRVHTADQHNVDRYFWSVFKLKGIPARLSD